MLGYAKISCNEIESWDRWIGPEGSRQQTGLVAQTRAIGPARLCKITWPEGMSRVEVLDGDVPHAKVEWIQVGNVSHPLSKWDRKHMSVFGTSISQTLFTLEARTNLYPVGREDEPRGIPGVRVHRVRPVAVPQGQGRRAASVCHDGCEGRWR